MVSEKRAREGGEKGEEGKKKDVRGRFSTIFGLENLPSILKKKEREEKRGVHVELYK